MGAVVGGIMGALVVLLVVPRGVVAAPEAQRQVIRDLVVQRLRLEDPGNITRAVLEVRGSEVVLALAGSDEVEHLHLAVSRDRSLLQATDPRAASGRSRRVASLGVDGNGPKLTVRDDDLGGANASVTPATGPALTLWDTADARLWSAP
jgi:hypothetical protein